jgi:hypothetical protein
VSFHGWISCVFIGRFGFLFDWAVAMWFLEKSTNSHLGCLVYPRVFGLFGCLVYSRPRVFRLSCSVWLGKKSTILGLGSFACLGSHRIAVSVFCKLKNMTNHPLVSSHSSNVAKIQASDEWERPIFTDC